MCQDAFEALKHILEDHAKAPGELHLTQGACLQSAENTELFSGDKRLVLASKGMILDQIIWTPQNFESSTYSSI